MTYGSVNWRYKNAILSGYIGLESIKSIGHCTLETISKYFKHHHPQQIASLTIFDSLRFRFGQELLSLQLRDSEPVISATKGRIFFFRRSVGQWFSFSSTTSEEELLAGGFSMFFLKMFAPKNCGRFPIWLCGIFVQSWVGEFQPPKPGYYWHRCWVPKSFSPSSWALQRVRKQIHSTFVSALMNGS